MRMVLSGSPLLIWVILGCIWSGVIDAWSAPTQRYKPIDVLIRGALTSDAPNGQERKAAPGDRLVELDMMFTKEQWEAIYGDKKGYKTGRVAISDEAYRWPGGVVPYEITDDFNEDDKKTIRLGMDEWERFTCVRFIERTDEEDYVTIFSGTGCWSYVGRITGQQYLSLLTTGCVYHFTIVHELGHVLGRYHEQTRPDRDDYITVLEENIATDHLRNFDRYDWDFVTGYGVLYDYWSIMHYSQYAFTGNGQITIKTTDPDYQNLIGTVPGLSLKDVHTANLMYKCSESCNMTDCPPEGILSEDCKCWCNTGIPGNPVVEWDGISDCPGDGDIEACMDYHENCTQWGSEGECEADQNYMLDTCRKTCQVCGPNAMCLDLLAECDYWSLIEGCESNPGHLFQDCMKSCKVCNDGGPEYGPCEDMSTLCPSTAEEGGCEKYSISMLERCPASCHTCQRDPEFVCRNWNVRCNVWAENGQCGADYEFMRRHCPKACELCSGGNIPDCKNVVDEWCEMRADKGDCVTNRDFMLSKCPVACRFCGDDAVCLDRLTNCEELRQDGYCTDESLRADMTFYCPVSCDKCTSTSGDTHVCGNYDPRCDKWEAEGRCDGESDFMLPNCPRACNICGPDPVCKDYYVECPYWAVLGECESDLYREWMQIYCALSCDTCPKPDLCNPNPCNGGTCSEISRAVTCYNCPISFTGDHCQHVSECFNAIGDAFCEYFAKLGLCEPSSRWMLPRCQQACQICGPGALCYDFDDDCELMAESGDCDNYPGYMLLYCRLSCDVCGGDKIPIPAVLSPVCNHYPPEWCRRYLPDCPARASRGECSRNPHLLLYKCPMDCGICGSNVICMDYDSSCDWWARLGQCEKSPAFMEIICRDSCNCCG